MDDHPKVSLRLEEVQLLIGRNIKSIIESTDDVNSQNRFKEVIEETIRLINECEVLPRLLDPHLQWFIDKISSAYLKLKDTSDDLIFSTELVGLVLVMAKVRGYKFVATFFSTDVYLFPRILALLRDEKLQKNSDESYFLLLWLSNLVLVPFPLNSVKNSMDLQIYTLISEFLSLHSSASKPQILCLSLLALLMTRTDGAQLMDIYINDVLKGWVRFDDKTKLAYLMTFHQIFKRASSAEAIKFSQKIYRDVVLYEMSLLVIGDARNSNTLNIKYLIKVASRITRFFINFNEWEIVADNIDSLVYISTVMKDNLDISLRECLAKCMSAIVSDLYVRAERYASQLVTYMLQQLDADLPDETYSDKVIVKVVTSSIPINHSVLLFCGFLAMKKSLSTNMLPVYLSIIHQTAFISYRSTGLYQCSQLRDASCFCMWAFIKNISKEDYFFLLKNYFGALKNLFLDSICVSLFDEDYTIRRCGIAVLQEFAGRFGSEFFPLFLRENDNMKVGKFTIQFIELFGNKSVGSLVESHELIRDLVPLGIPKDIFLEQMTLEIELDFCPFQTKVVAAVHLSELLLNLSFGSTSSGIQLDIDRSLNRLVAGLLQLNFGALYALAELQKAKLLPQKYAARIGSIVCDLSFDIHIDRADKGEALLNWYIAELSFGDKDITQNVFATVLEISRLNYNLNLVLLLQQLFSLIPHFNTSRFEDVISQIRVGNHLLAKSVCSHKLCINEFHQIVKIVLDKSIDAQTRAYLVANFGAYTNRSEAKQLLESALLSLLDDYTVSAQGDVGLLVRISCIDLIVQYPHVARECRPQILRELIRIAGETLDKLRLSAFRCLCLLENEERFSERYVEYNSDYKLYFRDYFEFIISRAYEIEYGESFWTGIALSAGASVASGNLINLALRQLLDYLQANVKSCACLTTLLKLLKIPVGKTARTLSNREKKIIVAALNVVVRVFDSAIRIPDSFDYETLFIRCYNLHINTAHTARISLVIKIFQHLGCGPCTESLAKKSRIRLFWLANNSSMESIRSLAYDAIFETILELEPHNSIVTEYGSRRGKPNEQILKDMELVLCE